MKSTDSEPHSAADMADAVEGPSGPNHGPLLNVINWILLVVTCLACTLKVFSKWALVRRVQWDDTSMMAAMV